MKTVKTILEIILFAEVVGLGFFLGAIYASMKTKKDAQQNIKSLAESLPVAIQSLFGQMTKAGAIEIKNPGESLFFEMHIRDGIIFLEFNPARNEVEKLIEKVKKERRKNP